MKLSNKILIFVILILFFSVGSISYFTYAKLMKMSNDNLEESLQELAYYVSRDVLVKKALRHKEETGDIDYSLNEHIEDIREHFDVNFITVFDMDGIRLTHPNEENIGYKFKGGDEDRVLKEAISYIS
ncbi:MAG: sensor histidine kinase, partial [Clostridiales bacterium]|nr:sensor histidine kinase [Clostridiales bacterium]